MRLHRGYTPPSRRLADVPLGTARVAGLRVPDPRRIVPASGDDALAIGLIRRGPDALLMSLKGGEGRPDSASQTRAVLSQLAVTMRFAVGAIRRIDPTIS